MIAAPARGAWSLRRELLLGLLAPLLGVVLVSAVAGAHLWDAWDDGVFDADDLIAVVALLLVPVAAAAVVALAVQRTVRRVEQLARGWQVHAAVSLEPMAADGVPSELMPFATALNDQLSRARSLVQQERQFCENASQQLRTPLAALELGLARASAAEDLPQARSAIDDLLQSTRRMSRTIEQLLSMARLDLQRAVPLQTVPTDLEALAREVGTRFLDAADRKGLELVLQGPQRPVTVPVQPDLLGEALANLVDNALRHATAGAVTIEVLADPPELRVSDRGPGVAASLEGRLFERFARGRGGGSGLGLAIARDILRLHGGELLVQPREGGGTVGRLVLGRAAAG